MKMFYQKQWPILVKNSNKTNKKMLTGQKQIKNVLLTKSTGCKGKNGYKERDRDRKS